MSRPRKPYGPNPPGRLFGTMIKVLAAELSDQGRLARGKRYWADDAVTDIVVGHGAVTAEIQGSRAEPYVVTLEAAGGSGVPAKRELWVRCTCPDDTGTGAEACKHAVAALFALSDEVAIEPELVDRWRAGRRAPRPEVEPTDDVTPLPTDRREADPGERDEPAEVIQLASAGRREPDADEIASLVAAPPGVSLGELPEPSAIEHAGIRDRLVAEVLADALDHLAIRWE